MITNWKKVTWNAITIGKDGQAHLCLEEPLRWRKPRHVIVKGLFNEVVLPDIYIAAVFGVMASCSQHKFIVATKKPELIKLFFASLERRANTAKEIFTNDDHSWRRRHVLRAAAVRMSGNGAFSSIDNTDWPLPNVWLGTIVEDQQTADERIPILLQIPAAVRFVSVEPMLGPVNLGHLFYPPGPALHRCLYCGARVWDVPLEQIYDHVCPGCGRTACWCQSGYPTLDWVIAGGETGPGARPMHPDWARSLRDQCQTAEVPFSFESWGDWTPFYDRDKDDPDWRNSPKEKHNVIRINLEGNHGFHGDRVIYARKVGKKVAGRLLDGREWNEMPGVNTND